MLVQLISSLATHRGQLVQARKLAAELGGEFLRSLHGAVVDRDSRAGVSQTGDDSPRDAACADDRHGHIPQVLALDAHSGGDGIKSPRVIGVVGSKLVWPSPRGEGILPLFSRGEGILPLHS